MAEVSLTIAGHNHIIACRDGEEDHLRTLAGMVDQKANEVRGAVGGGNATRQLLLAALLLADELTDARAGISIAPKPTTSPSNHGETLERLADKIEAIASRLEN